MSQRSGTLRRKEKEVKEVTKDISATSFGSSEFLDKIALTQYKRQILTVLMEENLCLSAFIVSNTKISDSSQPSRYFMDIIHFACKDRLEDFIFQLLEKKIQSHYSKIETVQDMKNVLRDNSLIMLMILQYIKDSCEEYFRNVFRTTIEEMIPTLDQLVVVDDEDKEAKEKAERLVQINVNKIVDAVITNVDALPEPIQRVCSVLRIKITAALTKMPEDDVEQDLHSTGLKRKESVVNSDGGLSEQIKEDDEEVRESKDTISAPPASGTTIVRKSSLARKTSVRKSYAVPSEISEEVKSPVEEKKDDDEDAEDKKHGGTLRRSKVLGKTSHRKRSKAVANTIVDTILASFMFLRILVPAITSPVQHKITEMEISSAKSRGLVQIGRALVSMCNELDLAKSSDKPTTLARMSLNSENKAKIKEFVHEVSISTKSEKEGSSTIFTVSQSLNVEEEKIPIHDEFIQFLINSLPILDITINEQIEKESSLFRLYNTLQGILSQYAATKKASAKPTLTLRRPSSAIGDKAKGI